MSVQFSRGELFPSMLRVSAAPTRPDVGQSKDACHNGGIYFISVRTANRKYVSISFEFEARKRFLQIWCFRMPKGAIYGHWCEYNWAWYLQHFKLTFLRHASHYYRSRPFN